MRLPIAVTVAAVLSVALAGPAAAKGKPNPADFSFLATINCGTGPIAVGSTEDLYAPLVNLATAKRYRPVAWDVSGDGFHFVDATKGATKKHAVECSYVDELVSGSVTLKKF